MAEFPESEARKVVIAAVPLHNLGPSWSASFSTTFNAKPAQREEREEHRSASVD